MQEGVTKLGMHFFENLENLTEVSLPQSLEEIGMYVFSGCSSLAQIELPEYLEEIGSYAFSGCGLTSIVIPESVIDLGDSVFSGCDDLETVEFPEKTADLGNVSQDPYLGEALFQSCSSLKEVKIPENVTELPENMFAYCSDLTSVSLPSTLRTIEAKAFAECPALTEIIIAEEDIFYMEDGCLHEKLSENSSRLIYCLGTQSGEKVFPDSVTEIAEGAFTDCAYDHITIPGSVSVIPYYCFRSLNSDAEEITVVLQEGVTEIEASALPKKNFKVTFPRSVVLIDEEAISGYVGVYDTPTVLYVPQDSMMHQYASEHEISYEIIENDAKKVTITFDSNGGTTAAAKSLYPKTQYGELPNPTKSGAQFAGWYTQAVGGEPVTASMTVPEEDTVLYAHWSEGNVYRGTLTDAAPFEWWMDTQTGTLTICGLGELSLTGNSHDMVTRMAGADDWKEMVTTLVIGEGITTLTNPYGVALQPFAKFENLEYVTLPDTLRELDKAFGSCKKLRSIHLGTGLSEIKTNAFSGCSSLEEITIPGNVRTIWNMAFYKCTSLKKVTLEEGVGYLYGGVFDQCTALKEIHLPASVWHLYNAFRSSGINVITVSEDSPYFWTDDIALYSKKLKELILVFGDISGEYQVPDEITKLGSFAIENKNLTKITVHGGVREISPSCFFNCQNLTEVVLEEGVEKIGAEAFRGCVSLPALVLPDSLTEIEDEGIYEKTIAIVCKKGHVGEEYAKLYGLQLQLTDTPEGELLFDAVGGSVALTSKILTVGSTLGQLPIAEKEGFEFDGWYTAETGGEKVSELTLFTLDEEETAKTLYARYKPPKIEITFDANGGTLRGDASKYVRFGEAYGELPQAWRADYRFVGWYTEASGGMEITKDTLFERMEDTVLYAHWEEVVRYVLTFDAMGGQLYWDSPSNTKLVTQGEICGELPTPGRAGYIFCGWYTQKEGGEEITAYSLIRQSTTVYARWKAEAVYYTVHFDANGGSTGTASKQVQVSKTYGSLPTAARSGYRFDGWYTRANGGTQISSGSLVSLTAEQILYAHWTAKNMGNFTLKRLTWAFGNNRSAYGYSSDYRIPLKRYYLIYGKTNRAEYLYNRSGTWGGSCFGMSTTAAMLMTNGSGINPGQFRSGASVVSDLKTGDTHTGLELTAKEFIEAMQISQFTDVIQSDYRNTKGNLDEICKKVMALGSTEYPLVIGLMGDWGGHAVLAYKFEKTGKKKGRIYVYDCNYPGQVRYIEVKKNNDGVYNQFSYMVNDSLSATEIDYVPYESYYQVWSERNGAAKKVLLYAASENFQIFDSQGDLAATVADGELITERTDIYEMQPVGITSEEETAVQEGEISLFLPLGTYTVKNTDEIPEFQAELSGTDLSAEVYTTAEEIVFYADSEEGSNGVDVLAEEGEVYEITLSSALEGDNEEITVSGLGVGETIEVSQQNGDVSVEGEGAFLEIEGEAQPQVAVTASAGAGGSITGAGKNYYSYGSYLEYHITPDAGYQIQEVLIDGVNAGAEEYYGFSELKYPHTIEVHFTKKAQTQPSAPAVTVKKPGKTKITAVRKKKGRKLKVTWKKVSGAEGYQILCASDKKFKKGKRSVFISGKAKKTGIIKARKKVCYVKVRAFRKVNGEKLYGAWSKRKKVIF